MPEPTTDLGTRDEWCFEFDAVGRGPIDAAAADDLLCDAAIVWAESLGLGIGGGYGPVPPGGREGSSVWRYRFGLCVQGNAGAIPESRAAELLGLLRSWCEARGLELRGGYREFTAEECGAGP